MHTLEVQINKRRPLLADYVKVVPIMKLALDYDFREWYRIHSVNLFLDAARNTHINNAESQRRRRQMGQANPTRVQASAWQPRSGAGEAIRGDSGAITANHARVPASTSKNTLLNFEMGTTSCLL